MPLRPRLSLAGALTAMLAVSCTNPGFVCGCSPALDAAILYGRVTDAAGVPVQGARITAEQAAPGCSGEGQPLGQPATTGADGSYRAELYSPGSIRPGDCLRAHAAPPQGSPVAVSDTVPFGVRFHPGSPLDSVRVDLVLRTP